MSYHTTAHHFLHAPVVSAHVVSASSGVDIVTNDPHEAGIGAQTNVVVVALRHVVTGEVQVAADDKLLQMT